ncbi:protein kinase [Maioricimonas sp. JC845]|uniref:serine/threonine protein kinase n=1 Tax=Maioricimonas sp. JC845 TaxID=3232138 RepID=UPI00345B29BD
MSDTSDQFGFRTDGYPVADESQGVRARLPLEVLASRFVDEIRQGQNPSVEQYATEYAEHAAEIRELFPTLLAMERLKGEREAGFLRARLAGDFEIDRLGQCRIVREIGRGGMGVVFEAVEEPVGRQVAVKLLPWHTSNVPRWYGRFKTEARFAANLRHRHIVPIYSFGEQQGFSYYVMQFVEGASLDWIIQQLSKRESITVAEIARGGRPEEPPTDVASERTAAQAASAIDRPTPLPPGELRSGTLRRDSWNTFAKLAVQAAHALRYAHGQGTLHNDIKPGNLLLDRRGHLWMTDFGLAHSLDADTLASDGRLNGTLRYMAPERFEGRGDERSDVYSLGITLYELCTRTPVFAAENRAEVIDRIMKGELPPPRSIERSVPKSLETIILNAVACSPEDRYPSAGPLASDLLRFLNGETVDRLKTTKKRTRFRWPRLGRSSGE